MNSKDDKKENLRKLSEYLKQNGFTEAAREVLENLTPRKADVLRVKFGIDISSHHSLEKGGQQFEVTRKRIRVIQAKAIRKMRDKGDGPDNDEPVPA